ncbi:hypothetical protein CHS0354_009668 [Potamilus streckersoni]|uniref:Uncharacterized protein n=1 Tax=Potamilus streckersoni TaxID=2493646 RepID=A0AAE0S424_9BIVA|nr:hypothetical protein CHS0354_009668 [Potamilus streckersoni]
MIQFACIRTKMSGVSKCSKVRRSERGKKVWRSKDRIGKQERIKVARRIDEEERSRRSRTYEWIDDPMKNSYSRKQRFV